MCLKFLIKPRKETVHIEKAWHNDCLGYERCANKFNTIIKKTQDSFTIISLEGYSGWGKTFFMTEWVKALTQQGEIAAYYNAWDINALEQPLASFLNFFFENLVKSYRTSIIKRFANLNKELFSLNTLSKLINRSPLALFSILLDSAKESDKREISTVLREINSVEKRKSNLVDFQMQLTKIINKVGQGKNIYIMVDNLEICRTRFIVDFLESIRYILNIKGLTIIISNSRDSNNIQNAIHAILGTSFSLRFFTDLTLHLPKQHKEFFIRELFKSIELPELSKVIITDSFVFYAESLSLSLKSVKRCVAQMQIGYNEERLPHPNLFSFLTILQLIDKDTYEELISLQLKKFTDKYKPIILRHVNGQKEWEILERSLENALQNGGLKQIENILL